MRSQLSRISPHQTSKVLAVLYFVMALPFVPFGVLRFFAGPEQGVLALLWLLAPVVYAVMGYFLTGVVSVVYNAIARRIGGIEYTASIVIDV